MTEPPELRNIPFRRIMLLNFGGLGDEILFFPVIRALRQHYPDAYISIVVEPRCQNLLEHEYFIDQVYTFDIKTRRHPGDLLELLNILRQDASELIISSGSSPLVSLLLFLSGIPYRVGYDSNKLAFLLTHAAPLNKQQYAAKMYYDLLLPLGFPEITPIPYMALPAMVNVWVEQWLKANHVQEPYVLIHPGVSLISKQKQLLKSWEPFKWEALVRRLLEQGRTVLLAGGPDDAEEVAYLTEKIQHPQFVSLYGHTKSMYQLGGFIQRSAVMVCVDSAPLHLAVALQSRVVAIFGPTDEKKLLPAGQPNIRVMTVPSVSCRPCLWDTRQTTCDALSCLVELGVEQVHQAVDELWQLHVAEQAALTAPVASSELEEV